MTASQRLSTSSVLAHVCRILSVTAEKSVTALFVLAGGGALNCMLRCENAPETSIGSPCRAACASPATVQRELVKMAHPFKNIAHYGFAHASTGADPCDHDPGQISHEP
jgi:hypothetical protein